MLQRDCHLCNTKPYNIVYESRNFLLIRQDFNFSPSISIIPKKHYNCSSKIKNLEEILELEYLKIFAKEWYKEEFEKICIFEYGSRILNNVNSKNLHMQIFMVPYSGNFLKACDRIKKQTIKIPGISYISKYLSLIENYIYYENENDDSFLVILDNSIYDHTIIEYLIKNSQCILS